MSTTQLIVAALLAAFVSAQNVTMVFYVKFNGTLKPLSGNQYYQEDGDIYVMTYGNEYAPPFEFEVKGRYLVNFDDDEPFYAGFFDGLVASGPDINCITGDFSSGVVIFTKPLYSCQIFNGPLRGILNKESSVPHENCYPVQVYILSYDRARKAPLEGLKIPKNKVEKSKPIGRGVKEIEVNDPNYGVPLTPDDDWEMVPNIKEQYDSGPVAIPKL